MNHPNDKNKIIEHYDVVSPYYHKLWGEHLHHGYWVRGDETKEEAQLQLIEHLARLAKIPQGARILDVGCGFGASSLYLWRKFAAAATGITISEVQVKMAKEAAAKEGATVKFCRMDAEAMTFAGKFDVLWSVESISHYLDRGKFFASAVNFIQPGGLFALTDWFKTTGLTATQEKKFIAPIEKGMFVRLETMEDYESYLRANGMEIVCQEELTKRCARTWDVGLEIIGEPAFWELATKYGRDFVRYLKAYQAMRTGYASGAFVYGLLVARKTEAPSRAASASLPFRSGRADCPAD